ncbi:MAG: aminomethyltransferase family protein [Acidimicrobiia bacterium]|nr:aminomethyltransferase family protein [Acidimicrobiia bacterium]
MSNYDPGEFNRTPFTSSFAPYNYSGRWVSWDRYHVPEAFAGLNSELRAVREAAVLDDKSPMTKYYISGPDAAALLDSLITRDIHRIDVDHALFTAWCNQQGKLIEDSPVFRLEDSLYCTTGTRLDTWFARHCESYDVQIEDVSDTFGVLTCQGPNSRAVLEAATSEDWSGLRFARGRTAVIGGVEVRVWRLGFTGGLGYELWVPSDGAAAVFDAMIEAGEPLGIQPWALNAVNVARVEAGFLIPGIDYMSADPSTQVAPYETTSDEAILSPYELGLGKFVDLDKQADFVGKQALLDEQATGGPPRAFTGLELDWTDVVAIYEEAGLPPEVSRRIRWERLPVMHEGRRVGTASSVCWSPNLRRLIGLGQINRGMADRGTRLSVEWEAEGEHGPVAATVVRVPFVDRTRMYSG